MLKRIIHPDGKEETLCDGKMDTLPEQLAWRSEMELPTFWGYFWSAVIVISTIWVVGMAFYILSH